MAHDDEIAALSATPIVLRRLIKDSNSRPAGDEGWTPREIIAHLRDCEEFRLTRCRSMCDEVEPYLKAFDQELLAVEREYSTTNIERALDAFADYRKQVVDLLSGLADTGWLRTAQHEEDGLITIESHIRHAISHDLVHLRQICESLTPPPR